MSNEENSDPIARVVPNDKPFDGHIRQGDCLAAAVIKWHQNELAPLACHPPEETSDANVLLVMLLAVDTIVRA
jgi:hypothetical protein